MANLTRKELVEEISRETHLRPEIVVLVLDSLVDITIESLLLEGKFNLMNIVKISSHEMKRAVVPGSPHHPGSPSKVVENKKRFRASLSPTLKKLLKIQQDCFPDQPGIINRDTWRGALKWWSEGNKTKRVSQPARKVQDRVVNDLHNPLLDDDE